MRILLRTSVLVVTWGALIVAVTWFSEDEGDANIGVGLAAFGLLFAGVGLWALIDGSRWTFREVASTWLPVAVLMGLAVPVFISLTEDGFEADVLLSDLVNVGPFIAVLIAVPTLVGGLIGTTIGSARRGSATGRPGRAGN